MSIHWAIRDFDTLPSTMDVAHEAAREGCEEGLIIVAKEQNAGRGRQGNNWVGPPGNLYCSIVLRPRINIKDIGQYSFIVAVALGQSVNPLLKPGALYQNKWPNDCLIDGQKFAGILIETGLNQDNGVDYLIIGIGVNIANAPEGRNYLNNVFSQAIKAERFLPVFLENFGSVITLSHETGFHKIQELWLEEAKGVGAGLTVRLPNATLEGIFNGLDENGALLLGLDKGEQKVIHSGEVFYMKDI